MHLVDPQGDGIFKVREGNNGEKLIQIDFNCYGVYLRETTADNETVTFTKTSNDNPDGYLVRIGMHLSKIINMPSDCEGWYRRFTENGGERIIVQKV
ncbi:MAG: hypothetical protein PHX61_02290 [Alphaproteobacteria bacterium]|nr:hypothetical protein [Alphaproteobacteria bacterium]